MALVKKRVNTASKDICLTIPSKLHKGIENIDFFEVEEVESGILYRPMKMVSCVSD